MLTKAERSCCQNIYEVTAIMNSARIIESMLPLVVENVAREMRARGCSVMLLTPDEKQLLHTAAYGLSNSYLRKGPVLAERSIAEALEGKPVAIFDAVQDDRVQYREEAEAEGVSSILTVPMMLRGRIIGVMRVYTEEPRHFTEDDIHFVNVIANVAAVAVENAVLNQSAGQGYEIFRQQLSEVEWARWHEPAVK